MFVDGPAEQRHLGDLDPQESKFGLGECQFPDVRPTHVQHVSHKKSDGILESGEWFAARRVLDPEGISWQQSLWSNGPNKTRFTSHPISDTRIS